MRLSCSHPTNHSSRRRLLLSGMASLLGCILVQGAIAAEAPGPAPAAQSAAADLAQLTGTWVVTAAEISGKPFDLIVGGHIIFMSDRFDLHTASGNHLQGTLRVDTLARPMQMDLLLATGGRWLAIYSVEGNSLRLNYVEDGNGAQRPTGFVTTSDTPGTVIVLRREPN